jgi:enterochelin esterase-like enzyme
MKNIVVVFILLSFTKTLVQAQLPKVSSGTIKRIENFQSKFVEARNVDIWFPEGYSTKKKYAVLYIHDGQMLFDSSLNWNHQEWGVDETIGKLIKEKRIRDCIVVAIWNVPTFRFADYFPQKVIESIEEPARTAILTKQIKETPDADNYLKFIVEELKPFIDNKYSVNKDVQNTFIVGSSMGGLISAYALCEYPNIFGGAACLSIHSPLAAFELINEKTDAEVASKFRNYLSAHLPKANSRKIYFDYGDQTGDAFYKPYQSKIDSVMKQKGWLAMYWQTGFFPGDDHSEKSWNRRLNIPLEFLLKK